MIVMSSPCRDCCPGVRMLCHRSRTPPRRGYSRPSRRPDRGRGHRRACRVAASMREVEGKVAFITGGGSGVGLGMAKAFVAAGMRVAIADKRSDHLEAASEALDG